MLRAKIECVSQNLDNNELEKSKSNCGSINDDHNLIGCSTTKIELKAQCSVKCKIGLREMGSRSIWWSIMMGMGLYV